MSDDSFVSEINVTPFVDVMLVLLIIFMVTAPMMTEGLEIELPKIKSAEVMSTDENHIMVTVKDDGQIMINDLQADLVEFEAFLTDAMAHSNGQLFFKADKAVPYGLIMEVMGQIRACGIQDIGMVAESAPLPVEGG